MQARGIYEQVLYGDLEQELEQIPDSRKDIKSIDPMEAPLVLSQYLEKVIERALRHVYECAEKKEKMSSQLDLTNRIIDTIVSHAPIPDCVDPHVYEGDSDEEMGYCLLGLLEEKDPKLPLGNAGELIRPNTSIARSTLFTGARNTPSLISELKKEIASSDEIYMLVSFIRLSGLNPLKDDLSSFTQNGGTLKVITTPYIGATDPAAIDWLSKLANTEVKINYDTNSTRLHAKAYLFKRNSGFTTAYIGSSNLSKAAITTGLEWNVKLTRYDLPETIEVIESTFDSYWNSPLFVTYTKEQSEKLSNALKAEKHVGLATRFRYIADIKPYDFQQEILDKLSAERTIHGRHRNLIVAATGTGKTFISAFDYRNFRRQHPESPARLLFVAHRKELLEQSREVFRTVLKDPNFGELMVGEHSTTIADHLFISIQTFNSREMVNKIKPDYYDFVVVDEVHHAAADSYQELLSYFNPKLLLGLTATPERLDGKSLLPYFDNHIAAEIHLPDAINKQLLCPFQYYGITDSIDLDKVQWRNGRYDLNQMKYLYVESGAIAENRAARVFESVLERCDSIDSLRGLGFCVSKDHAEFMAKYFTEHGIPATWLTADTCSEARAEAREDLVSGRINLIFIVDLYNEGIDIPEVNMILFLRPTESLTIFLQQLGRGLRLCDGKDCLIVLDFIGLANSHYSFENKYRALLTSNRKSLISEIRNGFPDVPENCYIELQKMASEHVLKNIRGNLATVSSLVDRVVDLQYQMSELISLGQFLDYYEMDPRLIYKHKDLSFSRLLVKAGLAEDFDCPIEKQLISAFKRFTFTNSKSWIRFLLERLPLLKETNYDSLSLREQRMLWMFYTTIWIGPAKDWDSEAVQTNIDLLVNSGLLFNELCQLLTYQLERIDFEDAPVDLGYDCPLDLHCSYTRDQILVATYHENPPSVREGVCYRKELNTDILFVTLTKMEKDYSPTTLYQDYSIGNRRFHWQTQSTTSVQSTAGQRYINHEQQHGNVILFVRDCRKDPVTGTANPYVYLGKVRYVEHSGSNPMNIIWELDEPIPASLMKETNLFDY